MLVNTRYINFCRGIYPYIPSIYTHASESYRRRLRSLLLCLCNVYGALTDSLLCWLRQQQKQQKSLRFCCCWLFGLKLAKNISGGCRGYWRNHATHLLHAVRAVSGVLCLWDIQARLYFQPYTYDMLYRLPLNKLRTPPPPINNNNNKSKYHPGWV